MSLSRTPKAGVKSPKPIQVQCRLHDCLYNEGCPDEANPEICNCSHPYKPQEIRNPRCSLYQVDFMKKMAQFTRAK